MKLIEVLKPVIEKQKLMEGQADQLIKDAIASLHNDASKDGVSAFTARGLQKTAEDIKKFWGFNFKILKDANAPNTWKTFLAKVVIAKYINVLLISLGDEIKTEMGPNKVRKLANKANLVSTVTDGQQHVHEYFVRHLVHFAGIDYPPIQNYNPLLVLERGGNISDVMNQLSELEDEYINKQEEKERYIELTGDEDWILEVDGYKWLDLNSWCSEVDGKAMRHCGNVPYRKTGDRVYTLNSVEVGDDGNNYRIPHVFFVLEEDGVLGERKGFGNQKPNERYHKAMVEFMKLPMVKRIKSTSRHQEKSDLHMENLNTEHRNELRQVKGDNFVDFALWRLKESEVKEILKFERDNEVYPDILKIHPYVRKNIDKIKSLIEFGLATDPSYMAYYLVEEGHAELEWAKEVIENDETGNPSWYAFRVVKDGYAEPEWAMKVIENATTSNPSWHAFRMVEDGFVEPEWARKVIENDTIGDPPLAAYNMVRNGYATQEWYKEILRNVE